MIIQKQIMMWGIEITYIIQKSNICDYNDASILVRANYTVTAAGVAQVAFKNSARFTKCITEIDGTTIDDVKI